MVAYHFYQIWTPHPPTKTLPSVALALTQAATAQFTSTLPAPSPQRAPWSLSNNRSTFQDQYGECNKDGAVDFVTGHQFAPEAYSGR